MVTAPAPLTEATLKAKAFGPPMCGSASRLNSTLSMASTSVTVPTVERGLEPRRLWSTVIVVVRPSRRSASGARRAAHHALQEGCVGLIDEALRLGGDGVDDQGALSRSGDAGEDGELALRDVEGEIPQIVLAGSLDADAVVRVGRHTR
jgi:hypothetical protein